MKSMLTLFLICHILALPSFAQKQANNWYFGNHAAISFANNSPSALNNSSMEASGATVSHSDPNTGDLLFYSNGQKVWNRNHEVMLNGNNLFGSTFSTNTSYAVPFPDSKTQYYLFTIQTDSLVPSNPTRKSTIYYSVIDLELNNSLGGIVEDKKNILLTDSVTSKVSAIPHADGSGYWVVTHEMNNNKFLVYLINKDTIELIHQISIGSNHFLSNSNLWEHSGHMKASPDNSKLAVTLIGWDEDNLLDVSAPAELFDFDNSTGLISNPVHLGDYSLSYGISFSPDSKLLYLHGHSKLDGDLLFQFDLSAENIKNSKIGLLRSNPRSNYLSSLAVFGLQIGPDGRIYGGGNPVIADDHTPSNNLLVINNPNKRGIAANISYMPFDWPENRITNDLPNFIQFYFKDLTPVNNPNAPCAFDKNIFVYPNPATDIINIILSEWCFSSFQVSIFNTLGQMLSTYTISDSNSITIPVNELASGVYLLKLNQGSQKLVTKFVKKSTD